MMDLIGLLQHLCDPDMHRLTPPMWNEKLDEWKRGVPQTYPKRAVAAAFYYETSGFVDPYSTAYHEAFVEMEETSTAPPQEQDYSLFSEHLSRNTDEWAAAFDNISGDTRLVIPVPKPGLNFRTMKDFVDNASYRHQAQFWKRVAAEIERRQARSAGAKVYVSTHGHGVAYFHLRICSVPKYYTTMWLTV